MRALLASFLVPAIAVLGAAACATTDDGADADESAITESEVALDPGALLVKDPKTLVELEKRGLTFGALIGDAKATSGKDLQAVRKFKQIVDTIDRDLGELREQDPKSGVGFDFLHRQFDPKWLRSAQSRFELIGVVNRLDRMKPKSCGDVRLIYRLAYTAARSEGRLPMTVSFVIPQKDDGVGCSTVAARWLSAKAGTADALLDGPLEDRAPVEWIDVNLQAVRWPSNARRDLGGQAEYILRSFWVRGDQAQPQLLENTPRTDLNDDERGALRTWIREHVDEIDSGRAILPSDFLAKKAIAAGPSGLARQANRPFSAYFPDAQKAFGDLPLDGKKQVGSPAALLRRLDTMTCQGCHQARGIAGFHLLGEERDENQRMNALAVGSSAHFNEELPWRSKLLHSIANKQSFAEPQPFAERGSNDGSEGSHCGLGDPGFKSWTCAEGLKCIDHHGDVIGVCSPESAKVGDVCELGKVTLNADPHQDTVAAKRTRPCMAAGKNARCNAVSLGFPDGLCRTDCSDADAGKIDGRTICGGIPSASGLTKCLTVDRLPFKDCLANNNNPTSLRTCDAKDSCRDDYACMRVKNGPAGVGACMPPYFAFQARVDGHMFDE